jgi:uncharacterized membrane protein
MNLLMARQKCHQLKASGLMRSLVQVLKQLTKFKRRINKRPQSTAKTLEAGFVASFVISGLNFIYVGLMQTAKYWALGLVAAIGVLFAGWLFYDIIMWVEAVVAFVIGMIIAYPIAKCRDRDHAQYR